jgi:FtsZ-binding cell division protein ZapB
MGILELLLPGLSIRKSKEENERLEIEIAELKNRREALEFKMQGFRPEGENLGRRRTDVESQVREFMSCRASS